MCNLCRSQLSIGWYKNSISWCVFGFYLEIDFEFSLAAVVCFVHEIVKVLDHIIVLFYLSQNSTVSGFVYLLHFKSVDEVSNLAQYVNL